MNDLMMIFCHHDQSTEASVLVTRVVTPRICLSSPVNPLDWIIKKLRKPEYAKQTVADFGCGVGRLETELIASGHTGTIWSFDVGKCAEHVI